MLQESVLITSLGKALKDVIRDQHAKLLSVLNQVHPHDLAQYCGGFIGGSAAKRFYFPNYFYRTPGANDLDICVCESSAEVFETMALAYPAREVFGAMSSMPAQEKDPIHVGPKFRYCFRGECNVDVFVLPVDQIRFWKEWNPRDRRDYMKLEMLMSAAREWDRDKDKHFVEYVRGLSAL